MQRSETDLMTEQDGHFLIPAEYKDLLGARPLLPDESCDLYDRLLQSLAAQYNPQDIVRWLLVKDVTDLTWEIQRFRWLMPAILHTSGLEAATSYLEMSVAARSSDVNDELDAETSDNETTRQDVQVLVETQIGRDALLARSTRDQIGVVIALEKVLASLERRRQRYVKMLESQPAGTSRANTNSKARSP
jgi:hypothetical protein